MSTFSTLVGNGVNNTKWSASGTPIGTPTTEGQATQAYTGAQDALAQQQALAMALTGQGQQGMSSQSSLTQALMAQAQGQGPNPAQAQLAQATGQNVANQAALMAGQRGASGNAGLMARQAAQQGAATQQQAVGQGATMQAQQQLAAQQQLQNLAGSQVGQSQGATSAYNQAAQGEQANILNAIAAQNNARVGMQSNINNANSGMAQTNANNSAKFVGGAIGGPALGMAKGGIVPDPSPNKKLAHVSKNDRMPIPDHIEGMARIYHPEHIQHYAYGGVASPDMGGGQMGNPGAIGNASGGSGGGGAIVLAQQGVKAYQTSQTNKANAKAKADADAKANPGQHTTINDTTGKGQGDGSDISSASTNSTGNTVSAPSQNAGSNMAGGAADADVGAGALTEAAASGGIAGLLPLVAMLKDGGKVPGKAKVHGNSYKNDTIDAKLSPGEVVIPRSIMESDDPSGNAAKFVAQQLIKHGKSKGKEQDQFKEALKKAISSRKSK